MIELFGGGEIDYWRIGVFLIHLVVHYGIHKNCHTVLCQDLNEENIENSGENQDLQIPLGVERHKWRSSCQSSGRYQGKGL